MNSSIWPIDMTLTDTTIIGQSEPGINGSEELLNIFQSSRVGISSSDVYPGHLLGRGSYSLCRNAVGEFYRSIQLGYEILLAHKHVPII